MSKKNKEKEKKKLQKRMFSLKEKKQPKGFAAFLKADIKGERQVGAANTKDITRTVQLNTFNNTVIVRKRTKSPRVAMGRDRRIGRRADGELIFLDGPLRGVPVRRTSR